ncbi:MAG: hypothetical protein BA863_13110 [Desulfovibrio sp. S3730MH75]|nr:MAG: hypothetical protein BA863_13110 [Desulfovibrio sp. S3730MH75]
MTSSNYILLCAFFASGAVLAAFHFGGLWLTVRYLPRTARPRLFFWSGCLLRYGVTLFVFGQIIKQGGAPIGSAFLGFYLLRTFALSRYCFADKTLIRNNGGEPWR